MRPVMHEAATNFVAWINVASMQLLQFGYQTFCIERRLFRLLDLFMLYCNGNVDDNSSTQYFNIAKTLGI